MNLIKILLGIGILLTVIIGIHKIRVKDYNNLGVMSFVFCVLTFILTYFPFDESPGSNDNSQKSEPSIVQSEGESDIPDIWGDGDEDSIQNSDSDYTDSYTGINDDIDTSNPSCVPLKDVHWIEEEYIRKDMDATTTRGNEWTGCIGFGSSNLNSDGNAYIIAVCDREYSRFTAEIAPQDGFDSSEEVTLYIYGYSDENRVFTKSYQISCMTKPIKIDLDISDVEDLYFVKEGEYNLGKIAGQFINGNTGMGVLMRDAILYK